VQAGDTPTTRQRSGSISDPNVTQPDRASSGGTSPATDVRRSKDMSPLKGDKKDTLGRRLSKLLNRTNTKSGLAKSQTVSHYATVLRKKVVSKQDMMSLQEDARAQPPAWLVKFEEEAMPHFEAFVSALGQKPEYAPHSIPRYCEQM
jgi:hypothetical protein